MEPSDNTNSTKNGNVDRLQKDGKEILLIGTAHVSRKSVDLVQEIIETENPDTVCVELCESRYQSIRQKNRWQEMDIVKVIKEKKTFLLLSNLLLATFQRRIAEKLDVTPGQEMITAIEAGEAVGAHIHLADRDIRVTLSRTWRSMGFFGKIKLIFQLLVSVTGGMDEIEEAAIEEMKEEDILKTLLADVEKSFPEVRKILIDERDQYLCHKIRTAPGVKIVAVVGAGHVPGIRENWEKDIDIEPLEVIPPPGKGIHLFKWILPAAILLLFAYGFYRGADVGAEMIKWWIMANGIFAGLGAILALASPWTVISAIIAAPLTSLNPMIAAGWISGLVEAAVRKPKVRDFENLSEDLHSLKGFWKNKVTRILLVVVFTNLGSVLGTFVALPLMTKSSTALFIVIGVFIVSAILAGGLALKGNYGS